MRRQCNSDCRLINIIVHSTHYFFSDWPKAYSEFSKSARGTFSSCRLYNNQVKDTQGHGYSCHVYDRGAWFLSVIMSGSLALCCLPSVKKQKHDSGAPNANFRENICSEDDLRSRIFGTFVVKFLACLPLLGFSNIYKMVKLPIFNGFWP